MGPLVTNNENSTQDSLIQHTSTYTQKIEVTLLAQLTGKSTGYIQA